MIKKYDYFGTVELISSINDICIPLIDEGYTVDVTPNTDIRVKLLSIEINACRRDPDFMPTFNIKVKITRKQYLDINDVQPIINHLKNMMSDEGFKTLSDGLLYSSNKEYLKEVNLVFHVKR